MDNSSKAFYANEIRKMQPKEEEESSENFKP